MEDEIKILEEVCQRPIEETEGIKILRKAITNLINKYKEQEKHIEALNSVVIEHIEKSKEQEKIIELMVDRLSYDAFYMDDASEYCEVKKKECDCYQNKSGCKECLLDYFKKKARETYEKR